ncbi:hypothetical protein GCK72_011105 [Caenorhabditis remanei]|uniref:Thioredoxin domain-containing protein n=1 Tax=Caenorhabditis remanei TaxID=31234 RepID=A0A6A5H8W8_CAERE|nr:hypothetical protein GCK72_011105 [Caenorhabditis remanei]KAF1762842.1 hypothetical protein GCK72_011105 [Caenorhabditis remanei]
MSPMKTMKNNNTEDLRRLNGVHIVPTLLRFKSDRLRVIMNGVSINLYNPKEATKRFLKTSKPGVMPVVRDNIVNAVTAIRGEMGDPYVAKYEQTLEKENSDLLFYSDGIQLDLTVSNFDVSFVNIDTEIMVFVDFIHKIRSKKKWFWEMSITKNREMYKIENAVLKLLLCI